MIGAIRVIGDAFWTRAGQIAGFPPGLVCRGNAIAVPRGIRNLTHLQPTSLKPIRDGSNTRIMSGRVSSRNNLGTQAVVASISGAAPSPFLPDRANKLSLSSQTRFTVYPSVMLVMLVMSGPQPEGYSPVLRGPLHVEHTSFQANDDSALKLVLYTPI